MQTRLFLLLLLVARNANDSILFMDVHDRLNEYCPFNQMRQILQNRRWSYLPPPDYAGSLFICNELHQI